MKVLNICNARWTCRLILEGTERQKIVMPERIEGENRGKEQRIENRGREQRKRTLLRVEGENRGT